VHKERQSSTVENPPRANPRPEFQRAIAKHINAKPAIIHQGMPICRESKISAVHILPLFYQAESKDGI